MPWIHEIAWDGDSADCVREPIGLRRVLLIGWRAWRRDGSDAPDEFDFIGFRDWKVVDKFRPFWGAVPVIHHVGEVVQLRSFGGEL